MEAVKNKWLWGIFISIISIFAMSYNVNAQGIYNFDNYSVSFKNLIPQVYECNYNGTIVNNVSWCEPTGSNQVGIRSFILSPYLLFKKGDIVKFDVVAVSRNDLDIREIIKIARFQLNTDNAYVLDYSLIDPAVISLQSFTTQNSDNNLESFDILAGLRTYYIWRFEIRFTDDYVGRLGFQSNNNLEPFISYFDQRTSSGDYGMFRFRGMNFVQYHFEGSEENREQEQKTQEAVDESEAAGGSSSQSAQSGTTGLLNAITGAVNVISSASPTNCKINGNMGNLDIGQLDLCANPAPAFVQTIGSLILILMCVPLAISLFNRFISIFRSFQS